MIHVLVARYHSAMHAAGTARIIDGRALADTARAELSDRISRLSEQGLTVRLDAVIVTGNAAGSVYAASQQRTCSLLGIDYRLHELPDSVGADELRSTIERLNEDPAVLAIMVHLPLPEGLSVDDVQSSIALAKDVEGVNPANIGNVIHGRQSPVPHCLAMMG